MGLSEGWSFPSPLDAGPVVRAQDVPPPGSVKPHPMTQSGVAGASSSSGKGRQMGLTVPAGSREEEGP